MTSVPHINNVINGETVAPAQGRVSDLVDPSTGEVFAKAAVSTAEDVDAAFRAASDAFETWRDSTPSQRQKALLDLADAFEQHKDEIVDIESHNTGKPVRHDV